MHLFNNLFSHFRPEILYAGFGAALIYIFIIHPLYLGPYSSIPGPPLCKISRYYIAIYDILLLRNFKIAQWHLTYGPVLCFRPGEVSFSDPVLMREIYGTTGKYTKSDLFDNFMTYGERALFSIGPYWEHRKKRMLISSFYHKTTINKPVIEEFLRENAAKVLAEIEKQLRKGESKEVGPQRNGRVDAYPLFNCFSFDNITRLIYGPQYSSKTIGKDCWEGKLLIGMKQAQMWGPLKFNFKPLATLASIILHNFPKVVADHLIPKTLQLCLTSEDQLAEWNWNVLKAASAEPASIENYTLLHRLRACQEKDGESLSFNYIAAEIFDNINAAEETVAVGLTYFAFHLARQPEWQSRIRDELKALPIELDGFPKFADIDSLPLLEAFMREVFRVNPGASGRQERYVPDGGKEYGGIVVPEGTRVTASTIALHFNPDVFPLPDVFDPNRWIGQDVDTMRQMELSFIPFGYGARICLGKALGLMELKLLMTFLLLRYEMGAVAEMGDGLSGPMWQCGSIEAVPIGLRGDLLFREV